MEDSLDRLVVFLAKRDGIDKLVKTFQYISKLAHWRLMALGNDAMADRAKKWEVSCGLSRKAFRTGRFLTGLNALRRSPNPNATFTILSIFGNGGEMVYFFFDHLLWLARIGVLDSYLASRMSYISAFGESVGYVFFIIADLIRIAQGLRQEKDLLLSAKTITQRTTKSMENSEETEEKEQENEKQHDVDDIKRLNEIKMKLRSIRMQRIMQVCAIAANLADLIIALAEIEPNPFCCHVVTLGISGLVSAWCGWYRNWPASK